MGLHDRDYYRDEETTPPGLQFKVHSLVVRLVFVNVALFLANLFSNSFVPEAWVVPDAGWLSSQMSATPQSLTNPALLWQLITYGFAHANPLHILLNMFMLWMFGREIEDRRGPTEFLCVYLVSMALGSLLWCARMRYFEPDASGGLLGASGAVSCIVMLFILADPHRKLLMAMIIPAPAWVVGLVMILMNVFGNDQHVAYDVHLAGIAFAFVYFYSRMRFERLIPHWVFRTAQNLKPKPALKVHDPEAHYADLDAEADRILDKVHHEGEGSLSRKERKILKDYSRRMRQKRQ